MTYAALLDVFCHNHDPTDRTGQFCDRGDQYRPAILYASEEQKALAEQSREDVGRNKPFSAKNVTSIEPLRVIYPAEDYHQSYHNKNPVRFKFYKYSCGRPARLKALWGG